MARTRKRPSTEHVVVVSDETRVPVPTIPRDHQLPRYTITPLGHVFRDDGRLQVPLYNHTQLKVAFCDNKYHRSLPKLVFLAFGHPSLLLMWSENQRTLIPWVDPMGPLDPLTGRPTCTVHDVFLIPMGELVYFGRCRRPIRTRLPILQPPPAPPKPKPLP